MAAQKNETLDELIERSKKLIRLAEELKREQEAIIRKLEQLNTRDERNEN